MTAPTPRRLVPATATGEMVRAAAEHMIWPAVHMGGPSVMACRQAAGILNAGLAASPHAGRVSREEVERMVEAGCEYRNGPELWGHLVASDPRTAERDRRSVRGEILAALTALGLEIEPAQEAGDA